MIADTMEYFIGFYQDNSYIDRCIPQTPIRLQGRQGYTTETRLTTL